jgi:hypothetical protein
VTFKPTIDEQSVKIGGRPDLGNSCGEEFLYWDQAARRSRDAWRARLDGSGVISPPLSEQGNAAMLSPAMNS